MRYDFILIVKVSQTKSKCTDIVRVITSFYNFEQSQFLQLISRLFTENLKLKYG